MEEISNYNAYHLINPIQEIYGYEYFDDFDIENRITEKMNFIHHSCSGKDFVKYRECLLQEMGKIQKFITKNEEQDKIFEKFYDGIRFEIANYENYKKVDTLPPILPKFYFEKGQAIGENGEILDLEALTYNENKCTALAKIDVKENDSEGYPIHYYPYIWLSFAEGQESIIEKIFPNFREKILQQWDGGIFSEEKRSNPCWFRTFGPETGNIIHSATNKDGDFLFIVSGAGAGSGEFYYYTFFRSKNSRNWQVIGEAPGYGIHPFDFDYHIGATIPFDVRITEIYKNQLMMPWAYLQWEENFYFAHKIKEMLNQMKS